MMKGKWLRWLVIGAGALVLVGLLALSGPTAPPSQATLDAGRLVERSAFDELPGAPTYRIGINTEVTGNGAQIGDLSIRAARLAVEEINAAGGVNGIPLELVVRDCRSNPTVAVEQYRLAVAEDNLVALLGPLKSAYAVPMIAEHRRAALPLFIGATNYRLTEQGDTALFRMRPSDRLTATAMVAYTLDTLGARRVGIIHDSDAFGTGGAEVVAVEMARRGQNLAIVERYLTGATEFDTQVKALKAASIDSLLIYGTNSTDVGLLLRALRYWRFDGTIITSPGGGSVVTYNVAEDAQDGIYVATDAVFAGSHAGEQFERAFQARFKMPPDTYIAWLYDAVYLIAHALRDYRDDAGGLSDFIRATIHEGAQGVYRFGPDGEGLGQVTIVQMRRGAGQVMARYGDSDRGTLWR